jgi:hypothetical protein
MMGAGFSKSIGPKSGYRPDPNSQPEIDYKDPINAERAKRELYALFLDDKIVHSSSLEEAQAEIKKLTDELAQLKKLIANLTEKMEKINTGALRSPGPPEKILDISSE